MKRGQSTAEYILIFSIAAAALIGMSRYMGRAVRAHAAKTADELGLQEKSMKKVGDVKVVQDSSLMYSEDDSRVTVAEQTGGARATTYGQSTKGYGESTYIAEEEVE